MRKNGRWQRGSVIQESVLRGDRREWIEAVKQAGLVLDYVPELAAEVIGGKVTLNEAAKECQRGRSEPRSG